MHCDLVICLHHWNGMPSLPHRLRVGPSLQPQRGQMLTNWSKLTPADLVVSDWASERRNFNHATGICKNGGEWPRSSCYGSGAAWPTATQIYGAFGFGSIKDDYFLSIFGVLEFFFFYRMKKIFLIIYFVAPFTLFKNLKISGFHVPIYWRFTLLTLCR